MSVKSKPQINSNGIRMERQEVKEMARICSRLGCTRASLIRAMLRVWEAAPEDQRAMALFANGKD